MIKDKILKQLSIRSRMALGITCLERLLKGFAIAHPLCKVIDHLWEFTSSNQLDDWLDIAYEMAPDCILDPHPTAIENFSFLSTDFVKELKTTYNSLPDDIIKAIEAVISIGMNNIYSGVENYRPRTLQPLREVLKITQSNEVSIPDIDIFLRSPFSEQDGWGEARSKQFFQ
jgi:hypothetical protein